MENNNQLPPRLFEFLQLQLQQQHELDVLLEEFGVDIQFDNMDDMDVENFGIEIEIDPQNNADVNVSFDSGVFSDSDAEEEMEDVEGDFLHDHALGLM